jgi:hypothetical protein
MFTATKISWQLKMGDPARDLISCSDEELLQLLAQNDKAAFTVLFDRYATDVYIYIKSMIVSHTSTRQAGRVTQLILTDVFISLICNPPTTSPPGALAELLFSTARQKVEDYTRF